MSRCRRPNALAAACVVAVFSSPGLAGATPEVRLVFGSFRDEGNAVHLTESVQQRLGRVTAVIASGEGEGPWYRVATLPLGPEEAAATARDALAESLDVRRLEVVRQVAAAVTLAEFPVRRDGVHPAAVQMPRAAAGPLARASQGTSETDLDLAFQARSYAERGLHGQSRFQPSVSALFRHRFGWNDGADQITFAPFVRLDAEDDRRTHADVRELFWSRVGDDWDLHAGVRQVFWGVTEFKHLVDVINQTDLVENIDGEDKLGQPMVNFSWVRDWGIVDLFLLPGFRERTFPGDDGRLRYAFPVDEHDARYESGAEQRRLDAAVRWTHHLGPVEFGVYQFSGTSRDPALIPSLRPGGEVVLQPLYEVIDQTGIDLQAILGDWALKLEGISRSGYGERFGSVVLGFERTFVGALGRSDLGLVVEYMYDERGDDAFDTVLERDLALGTRWRLNDVADTQALFGVIWDTETDEYIVSLEASRRFGDMWALLIEGRVFGGADEDSFPGDPDHKTASLQRDDYLQLELTRYF